MNIRAFLRRLLGDPNPLNQPTIDFDEEGWIPCASAQPPFERPVRVRVCVRADGEAPRLHCGTGKRTATIDREVRQERWVVGELDPPADPSSPGGITHWKPL